MGGGGEGRGKPGRRAWEEGEKGKGRSRRGTGAFILRVTGVLDLVGSKAPSSGSAVWMETPTSQPLPGPSLPCAQLAARRPAGTHWSSRPPAAAGC